jgi:hypothetical protein
LEVDDKRSETRVFACFFNNCFDEAAAEGFETFLGAGFSVLLNDDFLARGFLG